MHRRDHTTRRGFTRGAKGAMAHLKTKGQGSLHFVQMVEYDWGTLSSTIHCIQQGAIQ